MTTKPNDVMAEDGGGDTPPSDASPEEQQTVQIPLSAFPMPPKPGVMVQLKVVSVDQNAGAVNAVVAQPEGPGGSDSLASEFNQQPS